MFSQRYRRAQSLFSRTILSNYTINTAKAISQEEIKQILIDFSKEDANLRVAYLNEDQFGFYLAGLLEGDGSISLPSLGNTILNRVLNPRIVFTTHKNNLGLYVYIQSKLGGVGRFQFSGQNTVRYIIGDIKSIQLFINLIHGKLRTSKNIRFNDLIKFINAKYSLDIPESTLDTSDLSDNSWLAGFTEADGHFGVKIVESKPKSDTRKRSVSENICLKFRLDQRAYDIPTSSSMRPVMRKLASFLLCDLKTYQIKTGSGSSEILSIGVSAIDKLKTIVNYSDERRSSGVKGKDFKC
jgi:hypothetical protein